MGRRAHCKSAVSSSRSSTRRACIAQSLPCDCNGWATRSSAASMGSQRSRATRKSIWKHRVRDVRRSKSIFKRLGERVRELRRSQRIAHETAKTCFRVKRCWNGIVTSRRSLAIRRIMLLLRRGSISRKSNKQPEKTAQQSVTYSRNHVFERSAVQDERSILQAAMDRSMGEATYSQVRQEFEQRVRHGEFRLVERTDGRAAPQYTTAEMIRLEREIVGSVQVRQSATL